MLRLGATLCAAVVCALLLPSLASAGVFRVSGSEIIYDSDPGQTDDIAGFATADSIRFTRFGGAALGGQGACVQFGDTVTCPKAGISTVVLNLGDQNDVASVDPSVHPTVVFDGGDGNDGLFGGGGVDIFLGGTGNDNIVSRDGHAEQVNCGSGHDTAISDDADTRISCEEVEGDADLDGVRVPADCNDANPAIHPGAVDIPDDGIDQDCSGADATNLDRDGDGFPRPQDCNDNNRRVHPGAREVPGNAVDENCDRIVEPFPPIRGSLFGAWTQAGSGTRNLTLLAKGFPRRTSIVMRCSGRGCPFRSVKRRVRGRPVNLHGPLGSHVLGRGTRLEVRFTLRNHIGRVLRFRMRSPGVPDTDFLCQPPGRRVRDC